MPEGICKLTGTEGQFVKAHLFPKAFYKLSGNKPLKIVSGTPVAPPKRSQEGVYDGSIVIKETEQFFAELDDHAAKVLKRPVSEDQLIKENGKIAYDDEDGLPLGFMLEDFDPVKLKLFFISIMWRFGVSSREEASQVNLGPHLDKMADLLVNKTAPPGHVYSVIGSRFVDEDRVLVSMPTRTRMQGVNLWHMTFGSYEFFFKADSRNFPSPLDGLCLGDQPAMPLMLRKFQGSRLWDKYARIVKQHVAYQRP